MADKFEFTPQVASRKVLTPNAQKHADKALITKYDYLQCQAAACTFIALSNPDLAKRDKVKMQTSSSESEPPPDVPIVMAEDDDPGNSSLAVELESAALEIGTSDEWNHQLHMVRSSKLLMQEEGIEPLDDVFLLTSVRDQIEHYQAGKINRQQATTLLMELGASLFEMYYQSMTSLKIELRRSLSERKTRAEIVRLHLTNAERDQSEESPQASASGEQERSQESPTEPRNEEPEGKGESWQGPTRKEQKKGEESPKSPWSEAREAWKDSYQGPVQRGEGPPDIRVLMGNRCRKPLRNAFCAALFCTALTGVGYLAATSYSKGVRQRKAR